MFRFRVGFLKDGIFLDLVVGYLLIFKRGLVVKKLKINMFEFIWGIVKSDIGDFVFFEIILGCEGGFW